MSPLFKDDKMEALRGKWYLRDIKKKKVELGSDPALSDTRTPILTSRLPPRMYFLNV